MKRTTNDHLEEHLQVIDQMVEKGTDEFFYTRLKARMEDRIQVKEWGLPVKPAWVIGTLILFCALNFFTLREKFNSNSTTQSEKNIESFAASYGQTISSTLQ